MSDSDMLSTCFWFSGDGMDAARFYVSLLPNSELLTEAPPGCSPLIVRFRLVGVPYQILNGGPMYPQTPAASILVHTDDQEETDRLWNALVDNGGEPGRCGWLKDRWGLSWQIVPRALGRWLMSDDREGAARVAQAMQAMCNLNIATLQEAFEATAHGEQGTD